VHLRRALLLFAIVLGLAAIAAAVSRPHDTSRRDGRLGTAPTTTAQGGVPTVAPSKSAPRPAQLTFIAADPRAQRIRVGQAATVLVEVEQAGQVEIADLGMSSVADPLTPGRFEVLTHAVGRHSITFTPAGAPSEGRRAGTLVVAAG
jgi:hypothetical protein